jgi:hypothetical protein
MAAKKNNKVEAKPTQLMLDLEHESLKPDFIVPDIAWRPLYRVSNGTSRFYCEDTDDGSGQITTNRGMGITSLASLVIPKGAGFFNYLKNKGEDAEAYAEIRAQYGTYLHVLKAEMTINGKISIELSDLIAGASKYVSSQYLPEAKRFCMAIQKGLLSWAQFMFEKNYEPLAIEISVLHPNLGYGCTIDDFGYMRFGSKRVLAIVDTKSNFSFKDEGKKDYYEEHEFQLAGCLKALKAAYPQFAEEEIMVFNWSPNNWKETPTYTLKNQSKSIMFNGLFESYVNTARLKGLFDGRIKKTIIGGEIKVDQFNFEDHVRVVEF